ncbi:PAS domain S-box protein [Pontiellaceae bacterium B1224]|nr:PAS domain S-box protein [Pontiellaceae bacterium B1224]
MPNDKLLHLLLLEDEPNDAELNIAALEEAGYRCEWERVETREDFLASLNTAQYDLILSDYKLPSFDGLSALELVLAQDVNTPFILISGTIGEDAAIKTLTAGATDYVLKNHLSRLGPVVDRALKEHESQQKQRRADEAVRESEEQLRMILEAVDNIAFISADLEGVETRVVAFSAGAKNIFGYTPEEIIGQKVEVFHTSELAAQFPSMQQQVCEGQKAFNGNATMVRKSGECFAAEYTLYPHRNSSGELIGTVGVVLDITERKKAEAIQRKRTEDLEQFNKMATGRELRMVELKKEINDLCRELGRAEPYQ